MGFGFFLHFSLDMFSLAVESFQLQRQGNRMGKIVREQAFDTQPHVSHAAGCIQPWTQQKSEISRSNLLGHAARNPDQGHDAL